MRNILYFFCWHPCINAARLYHRIFQYYCTCCNNTITANSYIIHYNSTHSYQYIIGYNASMYYCIVSNANIISNNNFGFLISTMNYSSILHIYFVAEANTVYIAPYYSIKPYTAIVAHYYIAYNGGIRGNKAIVSPCRVNTFYRKNYWHNLLYYFS